MIGKTDVTLFRRVIPRKGLHIHRWGPALAARIDRLAQAGLVDWRTDSNYPGRSKHRMGDDVGVAQCVHRHMGIRLTLTPKGKIVRNKM